MGTTTVHHKLSVVGEQLLEPALKAAHGKPMRIGAFYLGNWLTDVSQAVDPVAYQGAAETIDELLGGLFDKLEFIIPSGISIEIVDGMLDGVRTQLREARASLTRSLEVLVGAGKDARLAKAATHAFKFIGYFKFVADEKGRSIPKMDPTCYFEVFERRYTQYWPHEHLDRPEVADGEYDTRTSNSPLNKLGQPSKHDLYSYLRANIQITAGLLAYLDMGLDEVGQGWAAASFRPRRKQFSSCLDDDGTMGGTPKRCPIADDDLSWNLHLALLGHALHAIEDFFYHSNFVSMASTMLPDGYRRFSRLEHEETRARRLKKWEPGLDEDDWQNLDDDTHVATGYFDFVDTIISLTHVLEHLLGRPHHTVGQSIDDTLEYQYTKLLRDTLELVDDFDRVWGDPRNDPAQPRYDADEGNLAVKWLREQGGQKLQLLEGSHAKLNGVVSLLLQHPKLSALPPQVKDAFSEAVKQFGGVIGGTLMGISLYRTLKNIATFLTDPVQFFREFLGDTICDYLASFGEVYLRRIVVNYIGGNRIGCHSLMAKDAGPELFHKAATNCASAVHWYVVSTMIRHGRKGKVAVPRSTDDASSTSPVYRYVWVDWLHLLEHFLCNPLALVTEERKTEIVSSFAFHTTRAQAGSEMSPDSLATLAREFAPTFVPVPGGPVKFTWEVIADWNFFTHGLDRSARQRQVNKVLANLPDLSAPVADGNYAFRPGYPVMIPFQKTVVPFVPEKDPTRLWWYPIIVKGWKEIRKWYDDGGKTAKAPAQAHQWLAVPAEEVEQLINTAYEKRSAAESAYSP